MRGKRNIVQVIVALVVIGAGTAIFGDVYKWVDDDGREHFGNRPPPGAEASLIGSYSGASDETDDLYSEADAILHEADQAFKSGDFSRALAVLIPLAESGHPRAQNGVGMIYDRGMGVSRNLDTAENWYRRSAEQGYAIAQFNLAVMYAKGEGVEQDSVQAAQWYLRAAEQGHAFAQHNLASMYLHGEGVAYDPKNALRWERAAAEQGDPFAQYGLGLLYYSGEVIGRDAKSAYDWISRAMAGGYPITLDLEPDWKVGQYAIDEGKGELLEFVRSDDDIESWRELITIQRFSSNWGGATPQASLDKLIALREKTCAGATTWSTIAKDDNSVLYEWRSFPCAGWPSQHEIAKIIYRRDGRIFLHYANKQYDMPASNRSRWVQRFSAAQ